MFSVQPSLRGNNGLRVGRKVATFQLFFQSGRAKDLSAPMYLTKSTLCNFKNFYCKIVGEKKKIHEPGGIRKQNTALYFVHDDASTRVCAFFSRPAKRMV